MYNKLMLWCSQTLIKSSYNYWYCRFTVILLVFIMSDNQKGVAFDCAAKGIARYRHVHGLPVHAPQKSWRHLANESETKCRYIPIRWFLSTIILSYFEIFKERIFIFLLYIFNTAYFSVSHTFCFRNCLNVDAFVAIIGGKSLNLKPQDGRP